MYTRTLATAKQSVQQFWVVCTVLPCGTTTVKRFTKKRQSTKFVQRRVPRGAFRFRVFIRPKRIPDERATA
ncbi:hypothetical protein EVB91_153 [Rhizobium phage RHph_I1_18]|nr:hypothetical protein EVB91_153 [Rhizobium phage RHph_I1_18]